MGYPSTLELFVKVKLCCNEAKFGDMKRPKLEEIKDKLIRKRCRSTKICTVCALILNWYASSHCENISAHLFLTLDTN